MNHENVCDLRCRHGGGELFALPVVPGLATGSPGQCWNGVHDANLTNSTATLTCPANVTVVTHICPCSNGPAVNSTSSGNYDL